MSAIEKRLKLLLYKKKKQPSENAYHIMSFILTILCTALVIFIVFALIIPAIRESVTSLYVLLQRRIPDWINYMKSHNINYSWFEGFLADINIENMMKNITDTAESLLGGVATAVSSTISVILTAVFSIIVAIYVILSKKQLVRHSRIIVKTYMKPKWAERITNFCMVLTENFARFLSGQCTEAIILGMLMFFAFAVFNLPYAVLVGVLTTFCAVIPYIGAFISCSLSTLLIAIVSPLTALKALVVYLVVQFIENQFIYPRVVGKRML